MHISARYKVSVINGLTEPAVHIWHQWQWQYQWPWRRHTTDKSWLHRLIGMYAKLAKNCIQYLRYFIGHFIKVRNEIKKFDIFMVLTVLLKANNNTNWRIRHISLNVVISKNKEDCLNIETGRCNASRLYLLMPMLNVKAIWCRLRF